MKSTEDWIEFFKAEVPKHITDTRWEHTLRVAEFCFALAEKFSYKNPHSAYLAGLLHDTTKQKKMEFHLDYFIRSHFDFANIPKQAFHAFSAPIFIKEEYKFEDEEIFSAMRSHTMGKPNLDLLEKIVYTADFLGSSFAAKQPEYETWKEKCYLNLEFGVLLKAKKTIQNLIETNEPIHNHTITTYNETILLLQENL
ncbi:bis(5'-nucleosyl)-tetraphosphatase (symmetrical) YqeK [Leptospira sp. 96542]|nr:bis(5'-nucleosyl)-tetraphosphatase (symmetrical) YqeK [Leptospira sp. 96542]